MSRRLIAAAVAIAAIAVPSAIAAESPSGGSHPDAHPASCDGKAVSHHLKRAKAIIDQGYDKSRWEDKTPLKASEKAALRTHKFCIQVERTRTQIEEYRDRAAKDFREYRRDQLKPEWPTPEQVGVSSSTLAAIRECESGGDYTTDTGNGYYGAYQFSWDTWASVGGSGNPADASPEEQDYRAARLYVTAGAGQWPVCGQ